MSLSDLMQCLRFSFFPVNLLLWIILCCSLSTRTHATVSTQTQSLNQLHLMNPTTKIPYKFGFATWNLAQSTPFVSDCEFIKRFEDDDIVVLGVQECEDLRPRSSEGRRSLAWNVLQRHFLGNKFMRLRKVRMGGIQLSVFVKKTILKDVQCVHSTCIPCGIANIMVNKGAVCIILQIKNATIALINAHLAAHESEVERRNLDYERVRDHIVSTIPAKLANSRRLDQFYGELTTSSRKSNKNIQWRKPKRFIRPVMRGNRNSQHQLPSDLMGALDDTSNTNKLRNIFNMDMSSVDIAISSKDRMMLDRKRRYPVERYSRMRDANRKKWPFDATFFLGDLNYRIEYPKGRKVS